MATPTRLHPSASAVPEAYETPWPVSADVPGPGLVDLWLLNLPASEPDPTARRVLDAEEHRRANALLHPLARFRYLGAHIMLRRILGAYLGRPPHEVRLRNEPCPLCRGPHGRPAPADRSAGVHFSLSHRAGLALLGVASSPVGVDVEAPPGPATVAELIPQLHPVEQYDLLGEEPQDRAALFTRVWTRKEAYLKGLGTGLGRDLCLDYLGERSSAGRPYGWSVLDVPVPGAPAAACALRCRDGTGSVRAFGRLPAAGL
ncbi:4'-phosphopantetheinyl transferase family protein [Streptomyces sp. NPDC051578]|uniref:4'-phosphopantetheinyl transferase family protein n=1 Tax=Streptomyces sp. NPDC051578 TaxID=3365662 RepID=UPI00379B488D